jgi:uncharacterized surface protein with fasciclin (FAS1) repeats
MNNRTIIAGAILIISGCLFSSCNDDPIDDPGFKDVVRESIFDYVAERDSFSYFLQILEKGGIQKTLSAYNPRGIGYTLFLPDNDAVSRFIQSSPMFSSLDELLADREFAAVFSRFHVLNMSIHSNDFPFGAFPEPALSGDLLTVNFVLGENAYYLINNQAPIVKANKEVSNGYIHVIGEALTPVSLTTYRWLQVNGGYSIFLEALELTGLKEKADINTKEDENALPFTLLAEHDEIYKKQGINSIADLIERVSPDHQDYTDPSNPLYNFVGYHMLTGHHFLDNFSGRATNYTTMGEVPVYIDGNGNDLLINKGKEVFEIIRRGQDTIVIDWIGFDYDASNVLTQSGVIHFIDRVLRPQPPTRTTLWLGIGGGDPYLNRLRQTIGIHPIENPSILTNIGFTGDKLYWVRVADNEEGTVSWQRPWDNDYLETSGDFSISYRTPRVVQGRYRIELRVNRWREDNAVVEVYIDGVKLGGLINLHNPGQNPNGPYGEVIVGTIDFTTYTNHVIEVRSLIPGLIRWDAVIIRPVTGN